MLRVDVQTGSQTYPIYIEHGLTAQLGRLIESSPKPASRQFFVSSPLVWKFHGRAMAKALPKTETILLPDGEKYKQLATASRAYESLIKLEADRGAGIIAVGGGVIGDMAGFVAATYLRGIKLIQVPTTLLAQVDSAIGGKVGVNHPLGKNLIGAFHQPSLVAIDPALLETLPRREFRAGLYEVIKYGMTSSRDLFERIDRETGRHLRAQARRARADHRRVVHDQGDGGRARRARVGPAADVEFRPHGGPCARGRDEIQALPPRRSDRLRHARRRRDCRRARRDARRRSPGARQDRS